VRPEGEKEKISMIKFSVVNLNKETVKNHDT
jgi:hypothetical protein